MKRILIPLLLLTGFSSTVCAQLVEKKVIVPPQFRSVIDTNRTVMIPDEYEISVFYAGGLQRPRFMALGAKNTIYVADMNARHILALPDADHDGVADGAYNIAPDVDSAHSLTFYRNDLYVAEPTRVRKFIDKDGDGIFESEEKFITGIGAAGPYNHYTRTILFDTIGKHIYLGVGASCNACRETDPERGTILQFNLDGSGRTIFATGLRNALGLAIDPKNNNELWTTNADRDNLGDDIPEEIISSVNPGDFFGWPLAYGAREWEDFSSPEYLAMLPITADDSAKINQMRFADLRIPAHSTPMEIIFYRDPRVYIQPPPTTMFVALHGSSPGGRKIGTGYKVIKIMYDDTLEGWRPSDFITGFLTDSINYTHWGRPCGLVQDSSGDIFLSSDVETPAIYRIHLREKSAVGNSGSVQRSLSVFPNPSTTSATISYSLTKHQYVRLDLIDQLGRTVRALRDENEDAGEKCLPLSVSGLPAGIYYLRMQSEDGIMTSKIVVTN